MEKYVKEKEKSANCDMWLNESEIKDIINERWYNRAQIEKEGQIDQRES